MKRKTLHFTEEQLENLAAAKERFGASDAEIVRRAVDFYLSHKMDPVQQLLDSDANDFDTEPVPPKPGGVTVKQRLERVEYLQKELYKIAIEVAQTLKGASKEEP